MPDTAPLAVDREAVKAHVQTHGARAAAEHYGLNVNTVLAWSRRFGWIKEVKALSEPKPELLPASMQPKKVSAKTASGAALTALEGLHGEGKLASVKGAVKGLKWIARQKPAMIATALSQPHAQLTGSFFKAFPEQTAPGVAVSIAFAGSLPEYLKPCGTPTVHQLPQAPTEEE